MKITMILLSIVLLSACDAGYTSAPYIDPNVQRAAAEAYLQNTQTAKEDARRKADLERARIQDQIDLERAYQTSTAAAQGIIFAGATATAQVQAHEATQAAFAASIEYTRAASTQAAYSSATAAVVTEAARIAEMEYERKLEDRRYWTGIVAIGLGVVVALTLLVAGLFVGLNVTRAVLAFKQQEQDRKDRERNLFVMPNGQLVAYSANASGYYELRFIEHPQLPATTIPKLEDYDERIQAIPSVPSIPRPVTDAERFNLPTLHVLELVKAAIQLEGPDKAVIPGWRDLKKSLGGWNSDKWTEPVVLLKEAGLIETVRGKGTFLVGEYETLFALKQAIISRRLHFDPLPHPVDARWVEVQTGTE